MSSVYVWRTWRLWDDLYFDFVTNNDDVGHHKGVWLLEWHSVFFVNLKNNLQKRYKLSNLNKNETVAWQHWFKLMPVLANKLFNVQHATTTTMTDSNDGRSDYYKVSQWGRNAKNIPRTITPTMTMARMTRTTLFWMTLQRTNDANQCYFSGDVSMSAIVV